MDDADSDADTTNTKIIHTMIDNRCSLWYVNTTGYAFLCVKIHLRP